jgi:organic radical activating enzyme
MRAGRINEWFESVYGEYPFPGVWMLFIRFAGCNQNCYFCDQDKSVNEVWTEEKLIDVVKRSEAVWVCLTGGEPLLQVSGGLLDELVRMGKNVVVETNGTLPFPKLGENYLGEKVFISCSPKVWPVKLEVDLSKVNFKFLVGDGKEYWERWLYEEVSGIAGLQPVWDVSYQRNLRTALEVVRRYPRRFVLSVQVHKYIGVK